MTTIDLHTHTTASDGSLTPYELIRLAGEKGLSVVAITDHDTVDGIDEAVNAGNEFNVRVIPGVEISVEVSGDAIHMLAYGIDHRFQQFERTLEKIRKSRMNRNLAIIDRLNEIGYNISYSDVKDNSSGGTVGRGHIALTLVDSGQTSSIQEAFERLLMRGKPAYIDRFRLHLKDAIALIHNSGGAAVWAHPGLHGDNLETLLDKLPEWGEMGLDGLECDYSCHSISLSEKLRRSAVQHGLICTGGSDFHGDLKPDIELGDGPSGGSIDDSCLDVLDKRISHYRQVRQAK